MKEFRTLAVAALCGVATFGTAAEAGRIERACLKSDRNPSRTICGCIQRVADQILTGSDQRLAARFFSNPQLAQDTRQSGDRRKEEFWLRYKAFGETAEKVCG